jgi:hypothetical protein
VHGGHETLLDTIRVVDDLGQGRDDDLLGPATEVGLGVGDCKHAGGLADLSGAARRPVDCGRVARRRT